MPDGFDTLENAALAAMREAVPMSDKYEYAGAIYQTKDGRFHYTAPLTSEKTHSVEVRVQYPHGTKLAALYHTHPDAKTDGAWDGMDSALFSIGDVKIADELELPYVMGHYGDGAVSVYRPGQTKVRRPPRMSMNPRDIRVEADVIGNAFDQPEKPKPAKELTMATAGPPR